MKPGTRAWDGLLEALRANLIDALFLKGMFSYAVSGLQSRSRMRIINVMQPAN